MVADCRLDNRPALCSELSLDSDVTDSAILLDGYRRWGDDLSAHLLGDFACVIWDWERQRCLAFRDPLGIKPLFYSRHAGGIAIASDPELIMKLSRPDPKPDDQAVVEHLLWEYASPHRTFVAAISRLPGGYLRVDGPQTTSPPRRYWTPNPRPRRFGGVREVHEEFRRLFFLSVERRLDSSGPVLAHLSGGLDSSLIVCVADLIRRQQGKDASWFGTVSERFPGRAWDEREFIQAVTDQTRIGGTEWDGSSAEFSDLDRSWLSGPGMAAYRTSGSTGDTELAVQRGARVMLSGEGGDQLGASSGVNDDLAKHHPWSFLVETLTGTDLSLARKLARARRLSRACIPTVLRRAWATSRYRRRLPDWLHPRWGGLAGDIVSTFYPSDFERSFEYDVQRSHWHQLTSTRIGTALDRQQRVGARSGVEFRFPFLDQELVEFVLSIPPQFWPPEVPESRLHREAVGDVLPSKIRDRRTKAIFSGALGERLKRATPQIDALFHQGEWLSGRYVLRGQAQVLLRQALTGADWREHWAEWNWVKAIATLETWLRTIFGYAPARGEVVDD